MKIYASQYVGGTVLAGTPEKVEVKRQNYLWDKEVGDWIHKIWVKSYPEVEMNTIGPALSGAALYTSVMMREVLDWTVRAHTNRLYEEGYAVSAASGMILFAASKDAMIKGLRKLAELKGSENGFILKSESGDSMGIAAAEVALKKQGTTNMVGAIARTIGFNAKQALIRAAVLTAYHLMPKSAQTKFRKYVGQSGVVERYGSVSSTVSVVESNQKAASLGYAVYVAPSAYMPSSATDGFCTRVIGDTLTLGQIAGFLQRSGKENLREGRIFD